jgi:ribose transport system permease protein
MTDLVAVAPSEQPGEVATEAVRRRRAWLKVVVPGVTPFVLAAVFEGLNSEFLHVDNLQVLGQNFGLLFVLSIGMTYIILLGGIDLSLAGLLGLGQMLVALLLPSLSYWSFVLMICAGFGAGLLNGFIHVRLRIPSFLASLGMWGIWETVALLLHNGSGVALPFQSWSKVQWIVSNPFGIPAAVFIAIVALGLTLILERKTRFGQHVYAIGAGEEAARVAGVPVDRTKILAFAFSGFISMLAGTLYAGQLLGGSPTSGSPLLLQVIACVVVGGTALTGGTGSILRTVVGVLIITMLTNGLTVLGVNPFTQQMVTGAIVIIAVALTMERSRLFVTK